MAAAFFMTGPRTFRFLRAHRLAGRRAFAQVFDARLRKPVGPLVFVGLANGLPHNRLGLSVGRAVGNAVQRHRVKRLLREAFRLTQHDLPQGYDVVIVVRPHRCLTLTDYRDLLARGVAAIDAETGRRIARSRKREGEAMP